MLARNQVADAVVRPTMPIARLMRYTAFAVSALLLVSACADGENSGVLAAETAIPAATPSPDDELDQAPPDAATPTPSSSGGGAMTREEADEANRRSGSADVAVSVAGSAEVSESGEVQVTATVTVSDRRTLVAPTVEVVLSEGIDFAKMPDECELLDGAVTCLVANFLVHPTNSVPDPFDFVLPLQVTAVSGEVTVTVTATSRDNPLDNDPDPTNNIAVHTIVVG